MLNTLHNPHPGLVDDRDILPVAATVQQKMDALERTVTKSRFLLVQGPAGLGKTYTVGKGVRARPDYHQSTFYTHSGNMTDRKLYDVLFDASAPGCIVVLDDTDQTLMNNKARSVLKGATGPDANGKYMCEWSTSNISHARINIVGVPIPPSFEFHGSLFIITNKPIDAMAKGTTAAAGDFAALVSRMRLFKCNFEPRAVYCYVWSHLPTVLQLHLPNDSRAHLELGHWFLLHFFKLRDQSFRSLINIIDIYKRDPRGWRDECFFTLLDD